jgi:hypothetical protein
MFDTLLSVGTVESITLVESLSVEITGPLVTSFSGGLALGGVLTGIIIVFGGVAYVLSIDES